MVYQIARNITYNTLEVSFLNKPDQSVLDYLKSIGFHWNFKNKHWYGKADERSLTAALNSLSNGSNDKSGSKEIITGGVRGEGYMGGGSWSGCNTTKHVSTSEINKMIKAEMKRLYPFAEFRARKSGGSGTDATRFYMIVSQEILFKSKADCKKEFMSNVQSNHSYAVYDPETKQYRHVWGDCMSPEDKARYFEQLYKEITERYCEEAHNLKRFLSKTALDMFEKARSLYSSFIHDETNYMVDYHDRSLYDSYYFCNSDQIANRKEWDI